MPLLLLGFLEWRDSVSQMLFFCQQDFQGRLPSTRFKRGDQLPMNVGDRHCEPLFPFGYGLTMNTTDLIALIHFENSSRSNVTGCATHCWDGGTTTVPRSLEFLVPRTTNESWESSAGGLLPSHRRSLFSLASSMLVFAAKAYHCPSIIMHVKVGLVDRTGKPVDPFLELVDDNKLRALNLMSSEEKSSYGSTGDVAAARTSLSTITVTGDQSTEYLASLITSCINNFSEVETSSLKEELLQNFSPDDASSGLGTSLYTETPRACSPYGKLNNEISHKASLITSAEEDTTNDLSGAITNIDEQDANDAKNVISVNQLLESVLDTARHVATVSVSHTPATYAELASQCEALVKGKQKKMSVLMSFKRRSEPLLLQMPGDFDSNEVAVYETDQELEKISNGNHTSWSKFTNNKATRKEGRNSLQYFRLPPASPYDNFLKAAHC